MQRKIVGTLMGTAALGGLGQLVGLTVGGLIVKDMLGGAKWVGTANAASSIGTAIGALTLARMVQRRGRRIPLVVGYTVGMVGGAVAVVAAARSSYPLFMLGLLLFGVANTSNQQSRFAAADVAPPASRARFVGWVVWASTLGVVLGPKVAEPAGDRLKWLGKSAVNGELQSEGIKLGGAFALGALAFGIAAVILFIMLRPDPMTIARQNANPTGAPVAATAIASVKEMLMRPAVRLPVITLMVNQVVMVAIMSVTNVHLRDNGYTIGGVGTVISGHVLGMFAPSPISGWLCDKIGRVSVIVGSCFIMVTGALLAAAADPTHHGAMITALFFLGLGWNGNFVAGSALVVEAVTAAERPKLQGVTDMTTHAASACAAIAAGLLVGTTGYPAMSLIGGAIALLAAVIIFVFRSAATAGLPAPVTV